jgi:two-component system cell cycle response regulator
MDDNTATLFNDLLTMQDGEPSPGPPLPMYLIVLAGGIPGAMLPLEPGGTRLGRSTDNVLQLHEDSVSRHHAVLRVDEEGKVRLTDLASTNGTFVNGKRIPNHKPVLIHDGDRLQFGSSVVVKFARPDPCEEQFQRVMFERTVRDSLSGLYNRSYFLEQVPLLADESTCRGKGMAILMIDIDHFKRVNDTFGHEVGDAVIREVANVIRQSTRTEDLVARYGGEEFVAALPISAPDHATERAERIRKGLADRRIVAVGQRVRVTASIGVSFAPTSRTLTAEALIAAADLCLYQAKNAGRDRVVFNQKPVVTLAEPVTRDDEPGRMAAVGAG